MSGSQHPSTREAVVFERRRRQMHNRTTAGSDTALASSVRQTYDFLRTQLSALAPGDLLVEADLMRSLAASRGAVRAALQRLADEGLVSRKTKVGTRVEPYVQLPLSHLLADQDKPTFEMSVTITTSVVNAPTFLREHFDISAESSVAVVHGQMFYGTEPIGVSVGYVPLTSEQAERADELCRSKVGTIDFIEQRLGVRIQWSRASLGAIVCDDETAARLAVAPGSPMFWLEQNLVDAEGVARGLFHAHYRSDRVGFSGFMLRDRFDVGSALRAAQWGDCDTPPAARPA